MTDIKITPNSSKKIFDIEELWRYRELFFIFVWRDLKVRYKQTALGILWAIFQPLASTGIFTIFFGKLAKIPSGDLPYSIFVFSGLIYWFLFSNSLSRISEIMVSEQNLIKKIYFPKIILAFSSIIVNLFDFGINLIVLILFLFLFGFIPSILIILIIPLSIFITCMTALGLGLFLASLNVKYRDVRYILPFFIQLLLFITPVIYPLAIVGERNKLIMALNPITSVVEMMRIILSDSLFINPLLLLISFISSVVILFLGIWYFNRTQRFFADIV